MKSRDMTLEMTLIGFDDEGAIVKSGGLHFHLYGIDIQALEQMLKQQGKSLPPKVKIEELSEIEKPTFPCIEGCLAEMYVDGEWIKGKIIKGYRFNDGIVTIETATGKKYWCGQDRTDLYREITGTKKKKAASCPTAGSAKTVP